MTATGGVPSPPDVEKPYPGQLNSVQLNIVVLVDVARAAARRSLTGAVFMMDNSVGGTGQGTAVLRTVCKPGQVLNWIVRPIGMFRRPDGSWPPLPKIAGIVFLEGEPGWGGGGEDGGGAAGVAAGKVCTELRPYGMPDRVRGPRTPVYAYWAAIVLSTLAPGSYPYRLLLELEADGTKERLHLELPTHPALEVVPVDR